MRVERLIKSTHTKIESQAFLFVAFSSSYSRMLYRSSIPVSDHVIVKFNSSIKNYFSFVAKVIMGQLYNLNKRLIRLP